MKAQPSAQLRLWKDSRKPQPAAASAPAGRSMAPHAMPRASHGAADDDSLRGVTWRLAGTLARYLLQEFKGAARGCAGHRRSRRSLTPPRGVRRRSRDDSGSPPPRMKLRSRSASTRRERSPPLESGSGGAPNGRLALTCIPRIACPKRRGLAFACAGLRRDAAAAHLRYNQPRAG